MCVVAGVRRKWSIPDVHFVLKCKRSETVVAQRLMRNDLIQSAAL